MLREFAYVVISSEGVVPWMLRIESLDAIAYVCFGSPIEREEACQEIPG
jgi:hypothetical protein